MKYENLGHKLVKKLQKFYEEKHPRPELKTKDYVEPSTSPSKVISAASGIRIIAEASNPARKESQLRNSSRFGGGSQGEECNLRITFVQGTETKSIDIDTDELGNLISELSRLRDEIYDINDARVRFMQNEKSDREALKEWEDRRETQLMIHMAKHNLTEVRLESAEKPEDILL